MEQWSCNEFWTILTPYQMPYKVHLDMSFDNAS